MNPIALSASPQNTYLAQGYRQIRCENNYNRGGTLCDKITYERNIHIIYRVAIGTLALLTILTVIPYYFYSKKVEIWLEQAWSGKQRIIVYTQPGEPSQKRPEEPVQPLPSQPPPTSTAPPVQKAENRVVPQTSVHEGGFSFPLWEKDPDVQQTQTLSSFRLKFAPKASGEKVRKNQGPPKGLKETEAKKLHELGQAVEALFLTSQMHNLCQELGKDGPFYIRYATSQEEINIPLNAPAQKVGRTILIHKAVESQFLIKLVSLALTAFSSLKYENQPEKFHSANDFALASQDFLYQHYKIAKEILDELVKRNRLDSSHSIKDVGTKEDFIKQQKKNGIFKEYRNEWNKKCKPEAEKNEVRSQQAKAASPSANNSQSSKP